MLQFVNEGWISLERVVEKMAHAPAVCYQLKERGFIREGYYADLVLVDRHSPWKANKENTLYKCEWSPFDGVEFESRVVSTFVNGHEAYAGGKFAEEQKGQRLLFKRQR
jgi:dihydroorotase